MNQRQTPVCRSISLQIAETHHGQPTGKTVISQPLPTERALISEFVECISAHPHKIEHLGRTDMVALRSVQPSPSSLLFKAVHEAFAGHHPLALRPEVLMYLITSTIAEAVKRNPEGYRHLFTSSGEKKTIEVRHDGLVRGDPTSSWQLVFPMFNTQLATYVPSAIMSHMLPEFSTATPESMAASMVSFMDAASPFYEYRVWTKCGIPEIRLLGTPDDWNQLLNEARQLACIFHNDLKAYFEHLIPVLVTLAEQANGAAQDDLFWTSIYKFQSWSGSDLFNGWITAFLYYIQKEKQLVVKPANLLDWNACGEGYAFKGFELGCVPSHVSSVPFVWNYLGTEIPMIFIGGVLGVDDEDGYLTPVLSYGVLER